MYEYILPKNTSGNDLLKYYKSFWPEYNTFFPKVNITQKYVIYNKFFEADYNLSYRETSGTLVNSTHQIIFDLRNGLMAKFINLEYKNGSLTYNDTIISTKHLNTPQTNQSNSTSLSKTISTNPYASTVLTTSETGSKTNVNFDFYLFIPGMILISVLLKKNKLKKL